MPKITLSEIRAISFAAVFLFVIAPLGTMAKSPRFEATQLVRYVLETTHFPNYDEYRRKVFAGTLTYDDEYRHPHDPPGPTPVNCVSAAMIGVTLLLKRNSKSYGETVRVYMFWTHSNVEFDKRVREHNHIRHFKDGADGSLFNESLRLIDDLKVDGVISVRIKAGRHEVLNNSFALTDCPPAD